MQPSGKLVGICNDLGAKYNSSKEAIKPAALSALLEQAEQSLEAMNVARSAYILSVNARQESFVAIPRLAARIVRAVSATEGSRENIRDVKMLKRRLLSKRKNTSPDPVPVDSAEAEIPKNGRSSSWLDFDGKAETLANIVQIVSDIPAYNPNEADLKVTVLKTLVATLRACSESVNDTASALSQARMNHNKLLYGPGGLYETGTAAKEYVRSVFGVRSEPARQVGQVLLTT